MRNILCTALVLATVGGGSALATPVAPLPSLEPAITLVANGCGRGYFRTADGACIPNQEVAGPRGVRRAPPCPPGFLRDPDPARPLCYPF